MNPWCWANMELRDKILQLLTSTDYCGWEFTNSGMKSVELMTRIAFNLKDDPKFRDVMSDEIITELELLIQSGEIIEIDFIVPQMPYRVKSFLLPKGTRLLHIRGATVERI